MKIDNITREQIKPVIPPVTSVTITFTPEEIDFLGCILARIGGSMYSRRGIADRLLLGLENAHLTSYNERKKYTDFDPHNSAIYFTASKH